MKPPPRKRTRTSRELAPVPHPRGKAVCKWPLAEQKKLLAALNNLSSEDLSVEATLDLGLVREHLPTRTTAEINSILETLKKKTILFAKTKLRAERREEQRAHKPLNMWTQEACAVSGGVEESLSSAFTQMLTVTSIEPRTLKCCEPPQPDIPAPPQSKGSSSASSTSSVLHRSMSVGVTPRAQSPPVTKGLEKTPLSHHTPTTAQSPLDPGTAPGPSVRRPAASPSLMTEVSFERVYRYLSVLHKPSDQCKLTPMESAIVLDLLMSLPEELLLLDCDKLSQHLSQVYLNFSSNGDSRRTKRVKKHHPSVDPAPENSSSSTKPHPPLNPFLIPVSLLSRKAPTNPT